MNDWEQSRNTAAWVGSTDEAYIVAIEGTEVLHGNHG